MSWDILRKWWAKARYNPRRVRINPLAQCLVPNDLVLKELDGSDPPVLQPPKCTFLLGQLHSL